MVKKIWLAIWELFSDLIFIVFAVIVFLLEIFQNLFSNPEIYKFLFSSELYFILIFLGVVISAIRIILKKNQQIQKLEVQIVKTENDFDLSIDYDISEPFKIFCDSVRGIVVWGESGIQLNIHIINVSNVPITLYPIKAKMVSGVLPWNSKGEEALLEVRPKKSVFSKPLKLEPDEEIDVFYVFKFKVKEDRASIEFFRNFLNELKGTCDLEFKVTCDFRKGRKEKTKTLPVNKINFRDLYYPIVKGGISNIGYPEIIDEVKEVYPNKEW